MSTIYICSEKNSIDWICWRHYGNRKGMVEKVLDANPQLAKNTLFLPARARVLLPDFPVTEDKAVKLWD